MMYVKGLVFLVGSLGYHGFIFNSGDWYNRLWENFSLTKRKSLEKSTVSHEEKVFMEGIQKKLKKQSSDEKKHKATLAGGCFWCIESDLEKLHGVQEVISGYAGGEKVDPSYKEVSSGTTGHLEAVQVFFNPDQISYSQILDVFWRSINPLDKEGQFVDRGLQYSPAIFYHDEEQKELAEKSKKELEEKGPFKGQLVTPILAFKNFYKAEDYHQDYYKKNPLKYRYYRYRSGRDQFLKKIWSVFKDFRSMPSFKRDKEKKPALKKKSLKEENPIIEQKKAAEEGEQSRMVKPKRDQGISGETGLYFKPSEKKLRKTLTKLQYQVTQEKVTEPSFNNLYWNHKEEGIYVDVVSGEALFSSLDKYDSGTGWPSFTQPLVSDHVVEKKDLANFMIRTEVRSKYGGSHLGHVFQDGPPPKGLRYCINSAALRFVPKDQLKQEGYSAFISLFKK